MDLNPDIQLKQLCLIHAAVQRPKNLVSGGNDHVDGEHRGPVCASGPAVGREVESPVTAEPVVTARREGSAQSGRMEVNTKLMGLSLLRA